MAASSSVPFFGLTDTQTQPQEVQQNSAAGTTEAPPKKKRNQAGNPDPEAEVVALSPRTLLATNRFVCEVCHKGFQREQNLQLHRRGHNLPWKLKQRDPKEARRRVYLCPEPTCAHHDPTRALGDLTGIKKHYSRKHGEKKLQCGKCGKLYAVESDWKAHSKICGTREYRCDCGTLFSRRDSFVSHRAFCDAAVREGMPPIGGGAHVVSGSPTIDLSGAASQMHSFADHAQSSSAAAAQFNHYIMPSSSRSSMFRSQASASSSSFFLGGGAPPPAQVFSEDGEHSQGGSQGSLLHGKQTLPFHSLMQQLPAHQHQPGSSNVNAIGNLLNLGSFFSGNTGGSAGGQDARRAIQDYQFNGGGGSGNAEQGSMIAAIRNRLSGSFIPMYNTAPSAGLAQSSATALLMKAAQMGSTSSTSHNNDGPSALLRAAGFGGANAQISRVAGGEGAAAAHAMHFHDLVMNSLASGSGGFFSVDGGFGNGDDDGELSTRDFLGVGTGASAPDLDQVN